MKKEKCILAFVVPDIDIRYNFRIFDIIVLNESEAAIA